MKKNTKLLLGFRNAPVTKFLVPIVGGCSALAAAFNAKPHMAIQLSHFTSQSQVKYTNIYMVYMGCVLTTFYIYIVLEVIY